MALTELDIKKVIVDGEIKYKVNGECFDSFERALEYIENVNKVEAMSDEERKAELDEMANKSDTSVSDGLQTKR